MCGRTCDYCGFSVEENGDFVEWVDGTVVCDACEEEFEQAQQDAYERGE